ncbi:interleukin-17 receptor E [Pelobates fuscus]|uniref:interleukin-17 receptor E n=1 Tax=Pelobates fuscus TaxID=191477 RepID=UPI002FE4DA29
MGILLATWIYLPGVLTHVLLLLLLGLSSGQDSQKEDICVLTKSNMNYSIKNVTVNMVEPKNSLPTEALNFSTFVLSNPILQINKKCLRINVRLNTSGLPNLFGLIVEDYNQIYSSKIEITMYKKKSKWKAQFRCCSVKIGKPITISLVTLPGYSFGITKNVVIPDPYAPPEFQFKHSPENREIEVSLSGDRDAIARLCYNNGICTDLKINESEVFMVSASKKLTLKYEHLLPCLCIEVFYDGYNSRRKQICPFKDEDNAYNQYFWDISLLNAHDHSSIIMSMVKKCFDDPRVSVCQKNSSHCTTLHNAVIKTQDIHTYEQCLMEYTLDSADVDPHLCFKFEVSNRSYIKCPNKTKDRVWDVHVERQLFNTLITVSTPVPMTFDVVICKPNITTKQCDPHSSVYHGNATKGGQMYITIPNLSLGNCVQVWRSDVRFSHKYLFCPDFSHKHLGLVSIGAMLAVSILIVLLFLAYQRIWKIFTAPLWRRTVLLVYSPDSPEYKILICAFADFLQSVLGCEVILDLWDMNTVSQIGMVPWFYQKRKLVSQRKGSVILVWTKRSKSMYEQWRNRGFAAYGWTDPTNLFGAAMACLQHDLEKEEKKEILNNYNVVYFEGLCEKQDIPINLKKLSRFRLLKDFYRLVSKLQDTTCLSPHCLIKAVAKYLMKKLISSENTMKLKKHVELCRQKLHEGVG